MPRNAWRAEAAPWCAAAIAMAAFSGCGGGGGGGASGPGSVDDPVIVLNGPTGRLSRSIEEANVGNGASPPPTLPVTVTTASHWFRLEFPFPIARADVLENNSLTAPFSYLNGAITVNDLTGDHLPGLAMVNGIDALGVNHANDPGFPHDVQGSVDKNLGNNVFLYVADSDRNLSTAATFGFDFNSASNTKDEIADATDHENGTLDTVRITVARIAGYEWNAVWTIAIGATSDTRAPDIVRIEAEQRSPLDPLNPNSVDVASSFIVEFSEPVVPRSVGDSPLYGIDSFVGNSPRTPRFFNGAPNFPYPNTYVTATVNTAVGQLFIPFDCRPLNSNNLATYRLRPLIDLPPNIGIDVGVRALVLNTNATTAAADAVRDLAGNSYPGELADTDGDGILDPIDFTRSFTSGPGAGIVNIPVSPEVVYWLPTTGNGIGAIDLNGRGLSTNAPGANAGDPSRASLITKNWLNAAGCEVNPGGLNLANGIALEAYPGGDPTPLDPCTLAAMIEFGHNRYYYPVGTGSYPYGPGPNAARGEPWFAPNDPGNPGTPLPGVNEGSSGFETLCRDSTGDVILTGRQFGRVGNVSDMIVGEFLDLVYYDQQNIGAVPQLHVTIWNSPVPHTRTGRGNTICDPPTPNPPPTRYWLGMPEIATIPDLANEDGTPLLLEGEEVFTGPRGGLGYIHLQPNDVRPDNADQIVFPHIGHGPGQQSASASVTYSSRQQIGNFLYAADTTNGVVHAINSNTMRIIASIPTPDPTGLAIAPDLSKIYVTNFDNDSVSVIGTNPLGPDFHREIARIGVGEGPRAICVQPEHEEILVCNYTGNTVSLISAVDLGVRKTLDALISGPYDIEASPRQITPFSPSPLAPTQIGWACGLYFAYVSNFTGNSVVVYESGPDGPQGIGIDNVRGSLPSDDTNDPLLAPRGLCYDPFPNPSGLLAGGCFVAHRDTEGRGRVTEIQFTVQAQLGPLPILAPPGLQTPPGFLDRVFQIVRTWGNLDNARFIGESPTDVTLSDLATTGWRSAGGSNSSAPNLGCVSTAPEPEKAGLINSKNPVRLNSPFCFAAVVPDRIYVSFEDVGAIQVVSPGTPGAILNTITDPGVGGVKKLMSYWRQ
ncbi:MAG: YncE family protein [Planctomycetes bacterium]|nr:YncE family protein [Planctomycetota bacterium]